MNGLAGIIFLPSVSGYSPSRGPAGRQKVGNRGRSIIGGLSSHNSPEQKLSLIAIRYPGSKPI